MLETTRQPPCIAYADDGALDTAAEAVTGLTLVDAADMAWASLTALADGDKSESVIHHPAVVRPILQIKPF